MWGVENRNMDGWKLLNKHMPMRMVVIELSPWGWKILNYAHVVGGKMNDAHVGLGENHAHVDGGKQDHAHVGERWNHALVGGRIWNHGEYGIMPM